MRKRLIQLMLVCLIVTNLSSGTLAVYTQSFELENAVSVSAKRFYIGVKNAGNFEIFLAPGDESYSEFSVTNVDMNSLPTETDMSLCIEADFSELYAALPGVTVRLTEVGNPGLSQNASGDGKLRYFEDIGFRADTSQTRVFRIVFFWQATAADQSMYAGRHINGVTLYVTGTQSI